MDKTPKERIVFDEGVYYGAEGSEISIEEIASREGITVRKPALMRAASPSRGRLRHRVPPQRAGRGTRHRLTGTRRPLHRVGI